MDTKQLTARATKAFGQTAVSLSRGPLGILALFIVLAQFFASILVGVGASDIGTRNTSVFVWFLVLFPTLVLLVFAWMVTTRPRNLYPPEAYRADESFLAAMSFGTASIDDEAAPAPPSLDEATEAEALDKTAIANLYWLGHDLMWSADMLLRQGPVKNVSIGLEQAHHHLRQAGLGGGFIEHDLKTLQWRLKRSNDVSVAFRQDAASAIGSMIDRAGALLESAQGNFRVPPHWHRKRDKR